MDTTAATSKSFEVNADGGRTFRSSDPGAVARVAVTWARGGFRPRAYTVGEDAEGRVTVTQAAIGRTVRETRAALSAI